MKCKPKGFLKRFVSSVLSFSIIVGLIQLPVRAETVDVYIPEIEIGEDILSNDVFYLTATNAQLNEGANERYLLRIARGGDCTSDSGVTVKISDLTAKYGKDYRISVYGSDVDADSPENNESLIERMEGEEYTQSEMKTEEEYAEMLESDDELRQQTVDTIQDVVDYLEEESGVFENQDGKADENSDDVGETINTNPLQQARQTYTGVSGEPQKVTSSTNTMQEIQQMANVITNAVMGATLNVDFAVGESEKYIAIDVMDNNKGDGDRYFYLMLATPYGTTTNSASSSCALTIVDDEVQAPSEVGFAKQSYNISGDTVTVEITREGAINTMATAHLVTKAGTAQVGRDFSPVDMDIVFPMGIDKRMVEIPIRTEYIVDEANFSLELEAVNECEISCQSTSVVIKGTAGQTSQSDISLMGVQENARVSDIVLGDSMNLSNPVKKGNHDHYNGTNYYNASKKEWQMKWKDNGNWWKHTFGKSYMGSVGASWTIAENHGADLAGVQVDWARSGSCATVRAAFVGSGSRALAWDEYNVAFAYESKSNFGDGTKTNLFCTYWDPVRISLWTTGGCVNCNDLWIHSIKPIYRPFVVNLQNAEPLTFLNGDGSRSKWNDATFVAISGANNDTNNQVVRYSKDGKNEVTLTQTIGGNLATPYVSLKDVYVTKDGDSKKISSLKKTDTSGSFSMTSDWIDSYRSYIYFEENNSSDNWKNPKGTFGLRGRVELKPTFGYKDAKVKINVSSNDFGYFKISGSDKNISSSQTYTYHRGDILKLSTVMRDEYKNMYEPAGYMVSYKNNESDVKWLKQDVIVPYDKDNGTSNFLDDNERLRYGYYEITPLFQRVGNAITVRILKSDISKFDTSYGFFNTTMVKEKTIGGKVYNEYIFNDSPIFGKIYALSVRMAKNAGSTYYPVWSEPSSNALYEGEVFYHKASNSSKYNIIELQCENSGYENIYQSVKGSVYRQTYNMKTKNTGSDVSPAVGAIVSFGTSFSVVGEDGKFEIPPFRAMSDFDGLRKHYIRYIISSNGDDLLAELSLSQAEGEDKYVDIIENGSENNVRKEKVWVSSQNVNTKYINSENGSIITNVDVYTDNVNQGNVLIIDGDTITVKAKMREPAKYTKEVIDDKGNVKEYPNTDENVIKIRFVVYDSETKTERFSHEAKESNGEFAADIPVSNIMPNDRLFVRVTTDKSHGIYSESASNKNDQYDDMNTTTYSDVFTGYTFTQKNTEDVPVLQHVDLPIDMSFTELPLIGDTAMNFDFPFVSVGSIKTDTGYKLYIGVSPTQISDTMTGSHTATYAGDTGSYYKDMFSMKNPIQSFRDGLTASYKDAFKNVPENFAGATSALGAPTWRFDVQLGMYFEFVYVNVTNPNNGVSNNVCVFTGVGGYIGVAAGFKTAWYTILPVVFIPAYFGVDISGNVLGFFGVGTDTSKPKISYEAASNATVDFDDVLGEFNASVKMSAIVQIYVGVGLAGTLGLRGGGTFQAIGLWEPSDLVSDWGADLIFTLGIWVDLFLFSVPLQYSFPDIKFGSFEEYANLATSSAKLQSINEEKSSEFTLRQPYSSESSEWKANEIQLMSAFGETSSNTIVENSYEHPDVQLVKLSDGSVFMAFLDTDTSRDAAERTVLKFAVYKDGAWSNPQTVQNDSTADFQPSACEIDNGNVMISWLSSDESKESTEEPNKYLSNLEVYTAVINPSTGEVTEETRLTNDDYYDYTPTSVYDEKTGDRIVYYVKTPSQGKVEDMINSYTNGCVVVYMLYSKEKEKWLFDYYYDNEVEYEEDREHLIRNWGGQRFLSSPIPELGLDVPNISDFTAITYNGISVYAYTIDKDSSNDTSFDKEIFIQCYDFATHMTYVPIRITNDNVCDTLPQFVRTKNGDSSEAADTKLFWYRDEKDVTYIDISSLIKNGVKDDGTIKEEYLKGADGETNGIDSLYSYVSTATDNSRGVRSMADFKAIVDAEDIYIVWTQPVTAEEPDADGNYKQCREVYATALIQDEGADEKTTQSDGESTDESGCSWADPYRLTNTNAFVDEPNAIIDNSGNLMVLYNSYNQTLTDDPQNPVTITDFNLKASYMEPCGAVDVTDITFSNETPNVGENVDVSVKVKNVGLTYANGYTVNIYEKKDGIKGNLVKTITHDGKLIPGNTNEYTFEWTVTEDVEGKSLYAETQEGGMSNMSVYESSKLEKKAVYNIDVSSVYQDVNGYHIDCDVTNIGNDISTANDSVKVIFTGPYSMAMDYTAAQCNFATVSLDGIGVDESKSYNVDLDVITEAFDKYGFIDCIVIGENKDGNYITDGENIRLTASQPFNLMLNGETFPKRIELKAGETMEFEISCEPECLSDSIGAVFGTDDTSVAVFEETTLKALSPGTTVIHGIVTPYGTTTKDIILTVTGKAPDTSGNLPKPSKNTSSSEEVQKPTTIHSSNKTSESSENDFIFDDVKESDWFYNSVVYTTEKGYFKGVENNIFEPYTNVTRGMFMTVLGRMEGVDEVNGDTEYVDVDGSMYYAPYIEWATKNEIVNGYGDNIFGPDDDITREQMAKIIANYMMYKMQITPTDSTLDYTDADEISEWAKTYVIMSTQLGILNGNDDGTFAPKNNATRAEVAAVIERIDKMIAENK